MRAVLPVLLLAALAAAPAFAQDGGAEPTGAGVRIAVLDTGIDPTHPEVAGRVSRESFAEPEAPLPVGGIGLPVPEDPHGQGTGVASVAAGATLGAAPDAQLLDLQVSAKYTQQAGPAAVDPATEAAAIEAMDTLLRDPSRAHVVLLTFAQSGVSESGGRTLAQQARGLFDAGVLVVVPAGPAANPLSTAPHVLTVAGTEECPAAMGPSLKPDLVARSQDVPAAQPNTPGSPQDRTAPADGTAYAAAQVAGVAAQLLQAQPALPVDALASFLRDAAADRGEAGPDACNGFGQLDAANALQWASGWEDPLDAGAARGVPGAGLALAALAVAVAALAGRRHG